MTKRMKHAIARLILTLATVLVVAFVMAALTPPVKSAESSKAEPIVTAVEEAPIQEDYESQKIRPLQSNGRLNRQTNPIHYI